MSANPGRELAEIIAMFGLDPEAFEFLQAEGGHINENHYLRNRSEGKPGFLLQRINTHVFRNVSTLMDNMEKVTSHLARAMAGDTTRVSLKIRRTTDNKPYLTDASGNCWRMVHYIENHRVYDKVSGPELAYEGARMFGKFIKDLDDLDADSLGETIPDFHNLDFRLQQLEESMAADPLQRKSHVREELRYVASGADRMAGIRKLSGRGELKRRVTHNDAKIGNVLFDMDERGLCVVDLDTVMPGYVYHDFGDGIRTFTNTGLEDDPEPDRVTMDPELFRAFTEGFLDAAGPVLGKEEVATLPMAGVYFAFMQGVRFLTDYLNGDAYYRIRHDDHNLQRARAQFRLAQDGEAKLELWKNIIFKSSQ